MSIFSGITDVGAHHNPNEGRVIINDNFRKMISGVTESVNSSAYLPLSGGTVTGNINLNNAILSGVGTSNIFDFNWFGLGYMALDNDNGNGGKEYLSLGNDSLQVFAKGGAISLSMGGVNNNLALYSTDRMTLQSEDEIRLISPFTGGTAVANLQIDSSGNIVTGATYRVYSALLTQTGTNAPVATVLENTLGGTLVWTRQNVGIYIGTLANAFVDGKTFGIAGQGNQRNVWFDLNFGLDFTVNTIPLYHTNTSGAGADGWGNYISVEIRVYN